MNTEAKEELELVRQKNGGFLRPKDVVEFAKDENTSLHRFFEWDDTKAAAKWRVRQAQELIRVVVTINEETSQKVRAFVSLSSDQKSGQGYRAMVDVIDNDQLLGVLIEDAKNELLAFKRKYETLRRIGELCGLFDEIEKVIQQPFNEERASA